MRRARGPRAGRENTREAILAAARAEFEARGYDGASLRGIARVAGVDARLVHHYFPGKEALFVSAIAFPLNPSDILEQLEDAAGAGERIVRLYLRVWDSAEGRRAFTTLLGAAVTNESAATMLRQFMASALLPRIRSTLDAPDAGIRANLVAAQLTGIAFVRYVMRVEPLASATVEDLVRLVAPVIQRLLFPGAVDLASGGETRP